MGFRQSDNCMTGRFILIKIGGQCGTDGTCNKEVLSDEVKFDDARVES